MSLAGLQEGERYTPETVQTKLTAIKSFYKFTTLTGITEGNPTKCIQYPKKPKRLPRNVLTIDEMKVLLEAPPDTDIGLRDLCYLHILYSGLRKSEACDLKLTDVDTAGGMVSVRDGKGGIDRTCPIARRTCIIIRAYILTVRPKWAVKNRGAGEYLFLGVWGRPFSDQIAATMVKKYAEQVGITNPVSCHSLRHACASHLLQSGAMNAVDIRDLLGHTRLTTTQRYLHLLPDSHKVMKHHPLEVER